MLGIVPAAGRGTRLQPIGFSKELMPVGSRVEPDGHERPMAVSEYLLERMVKAGATRICIVISPEKTDIVRYYGARFQDVPIVYTVQEEPLGLPHAIFCGNVTDSADSTEEILVGLPDTIWFPDNGFESLAPNEGDTRQYGIRFLLFPTNRPSLYDAVMCREMRGRVDSILTKEPVPFQFASWAWGAFKLSASVLTELLVEWRLRGQKDVQIGPLVTAWIERSGGMAEAVRGLTDYVDVGTVNGYREALQLLEQKAKVLAVS